MNANVHFTTILNRIQKGLKQ